MKVLFEVFEKLAKDKWSGEVQVSSSQGNAFVVLRKGEFVYAYRPFDRSIERFQKIDWIDIPAEARIEKSKTWEDVIRILLLANETRRERLIQYLKTERFELFFRIFFWTNVELFPRNFDVDDETPELSFYTPKSMIKLLSEARMRLEEWPKIQKRISSSKRIFVSRLAVGKQTGTHKKPDVIDQALLDFDPKLENADALSLFSEGDQQILSLCDGRHSVQDIVRQSADGEYLVLRRLIELWDKDLIAPKELADDAGLHFYSKPRKMSPWRESFQIFVLMLGLAALFSSFHPWSATRHWNDAQLSPLRSALEVYRAREGVYPSRLQSLADEAWIQSRFWDEVEYELISPRAYFLRLRERP